MFQLYFVKENSSFFSFALLQLGGKGVGIIMFVGLFFFEIDGYENLHMFETLHFVPLNILENG